MENELILVDLFDNEVGTETKEHVHNKGLLHRAFSVFIVNGDEMLLQKRAEFKYHSGGLWTNACCSHPIKTETLPQAVSRRLIDELNIVCDTREIASFVYYAEFPNAFEYEIDHVFVGVYNGKIIPNPNEISEIKWVKLIDIAADLLKSPAKYTKWFVTAFPIVLKYISNHINAVER